jgi:hypothetical protein
MLPGKKHPGPGRFSCTRSNCYLGITSRANLLATTSRRSLRFFPASIMAARDYIPLGTIPGGSSANRK